MLDAFETGPFEDLTLKSQPTLDRELCLVEPNHESCLCWIYSWMATCYSTRSGRYEWMEVVREEILVGLKFPTPRLKLAFLIPQDFSTSHDLEQIPMSHVVNLPG